MRSNLAHFSSRYQHAWNKIKWHIPDDLKAGAFIDIGCGIGNGVAAAVAQGAKRAVGIDRSFIEFSDVDIAEFPELCAAVGATSTATELIEGNIFDFDYSGAFDYAMMLDSAEHVPDPKSFFAWAYKSLRPGGVFLMDTCPLYYSVVGHHLWSNLPQDTYPWAHLRPDFEQLTVETGVTEWSKQRFVELNRATHDSLRDALTEVGFEVTQEHRSKPTPEMLNLFEKHRENLDLTEIKRSWLFEDWILLVGRK